MVNIDRTFLFIPSIPPASLPPSLPPYLVSEVLGLREEGGQAVVLHALLQEQGGLILCVCVCVCVCVCMVSE